MFCLFSFIALFAVISGERGSISIEQLVQFLEQIVQVGRSTPQQDTVLMVCLSDSTVGE